MNYFGNVCSYTILFDFGSRKNDRRGSKMALYLSTNKRSKTIPTIKKYLLFRCYMFIHSDHFAVER